MRLLVRFPLPSFAILSSFISFFIYKFYLLSGNYDKLIQESVKILEHNLSNKEVSNFIHTLNSIKKIPNKNGNWVNLHKAYNLVKGNKSIDNDLKTQLRITLLLKGLKNI